MLTLPLPPPKKNIKINDILIIYLSFPSTILQNQQRMNTLG